MHLRVRLRTAGSAVLAFALSFTMLQQVLPVSIVKASGPTIVINEINWAGSVGHPEDQWVELYNATDNAIDISHDELVVSGVSVATFPATTVQPHRFFLVTKLASSPSLVSLDDMVAPNLVLPKTGAAYSLQDITTHVPLDVAGNGSVLPFAGDNGEGNGHVISSMSRAFPITDGSLLTSWYTSKTIGSGIKQGVVQYGTPTNASTVLPDAPNPLVLPASEVTITPSSPTATGSASPVITGKAAYPAVNVTIHFQKSGTPTFREVSGPVVNGLFTLSLGGALDTGVYQVYSTTKDINGDHSYAVLVTLPATTQGSYIVNPLTSAEVSTPHLSQYPSQVNSPTVTISGTSDAGALVLSLNGKEYASQLLLPGQTTFSLPVTLLANQLNRIEVRAQDALGHTSAPAIAEVTHDNLAPLPLVKSLIVVDTNPQGTINSIRGLAGAVESNATVEVYSDKEVTTKIGSVQAANDGSFGPITVSNTQNALVYIVGRDSVGNMNPAYATEMVNPLSFATVKNAVPVSLSASTPGTLMVTWQAVPGAVSYRLKYKIANGTYNAPFDVCGSGMPCTMTRTLINLLPGNQYTVAVSAIDAFGNEGGYVDNTFKTTSLAIGGPEVAQPIVVAATPKPVVKTTPPVSTPKPVQRSYTYVPAPPVVAQPTVTPVPTKSPDAQAIVSPSPSPDEQGDVKSADTTRNYTPWIILAVLIGLAVLATIGYFYWFGGEAGDEAITSVPNKDTKPTPPSTNQDSVKKDEVKPESKEKRW